MLGLESISYGSGVIWCIGVSSARLTGRGLKIPVYSQRLNENWPFSWRTIKRKSRGIDLTKSPGEGSNPSTHRECFQACFYFSVSRIERLTERI